MATDLLKFGGSLVAIVALVIIAWRMRLGGTARLADEAEARELADNAICGFEAVELGLDAEGQGALLADADGRILLLAPHGVHFAARLIEPGSRIERNGARLAITTSDRTFPPADLDLGDAARAWELRLAALDRP